MHTITCTYVFAKLIARDFAHSTASVLNSRVLRALSFKVRISTCSIAMEDFSLPNSTCSSQSQLLDSLRSQETGSFQNQPPRRQRKRGIAALLDITNSEAASLPQRACKDATRSRVAASIAPTFESRGDPKKAVKVKASIQKQASQSDDTLYRIYTNNKELFTKGQQCINNYVARNVSWEIQKALAIQMMTAAMTELDKGIVEASKFAAAVTGFSHQVVRRWAFAYFSNLSQYPGSLDNIDDHYIETELSSERGKACGNPTVILHDEEFQLAARAFVHENAYRKGEPNLTTDRFCKWVNDSFGVVIGLETGRQWLHHLGFSIYNHQKGVFFDGHERDDVTAYRVELLEKLAKLDETTITPSQPCPNTVDTEKQYIRVVHDETTFYSNADQTTFWNDGECQVLRQKSLGSSIMISDFIVEGHGYLRDDKGEARLYLETQRDGYFNNEMFIEQVDSALQIFGRKFPQVTGIFLFDNAPSHKKYPSDGLNAATMNVYPGGKQPVMRDTIWNGETQQMVQHDGTPKGMKLVLQERGVDVKGMNADKMRQKLNEFPDFANQPTILEELVRSRGHICLYLPKYHCELNPIERNWCHAKKISRQYVNGTIVKLRSVIPTSLEAVTVEMMNKFFRTCRDYEMAYRSGCKGKEVEAQVKLYKSHRRVFSANS